MHLRFSSMFYSTQLVDIFSYEVPNISKDFYSLNNNSILVYNFNSIFNQDRYFFFCSNIKKVDSLQQQSISSISEIFMAANWLERENSELHGVSFSGKKDLRNLLLQYCDSSFPFQKSFPSVGLKEMFYNPVKDTLIQSQVSLQI